MPNWCTNNVSISGEESEVGEIRKRLEETKNEHGYHLLQTFVPMPHQYEGTVSGSHPVTADDGWTWYEWQTKNWGVKWGDCHTEIADAFDGYLSLRFDTPWGPPVEGLLAFSRLFPSIEIFDDWNEESPSKGFLTIKNGRVLKSEEIHP